MGVPQDNPYKERNWLRVIRDVYKLRITWVMTILAIISIALYIFDYIISRQVAVSQSVALWLLFKNWPIRGLADACLTTLIIGFAYEWIVRKESEAALIELISQQINQQKTAIIEEIPRALILNPNVITSILKQSRLEDIIRTGLQIKLGDTQMGTDIYDGLLRKTLSYEQRWANYRYKITLSTIRDENFPEIVRHKFYDTIIDLRYDTKLTKDRFVFRCVDDIEDYDKSIRDPNFEFTYIFPPAHEFPKIDTTVFKVDKITVNSLELNINHQTESNGNLLITCDHPELRKLLGQTVTVYYRYIAKLNKRGHLFTANVIVPTKNVVIELDYADTDIHYVNVLDFFVSTELPKITYLPSLAQAHKIEVEINEWAFPKGGVVFVWVLSK